ncbi:hypothetical protein SXCC_04804 [Gluconacetobacter sp. SXCC-1]|nr:hypothetical protein SXCC_04804 [Gluconacetobacter sp. SXCC-1]
MTTLTPAFGTFGLPFLFRRDLAGGLDRVDHVGAGQRFHVMA